MPKPDSALPQSRPHLAAEGVVVHITPLFREIQGLEAGTGKVSVLGGCSPGPTSLPFLQLLCIRLPHPRVGWSPPEVSGE